MGHSLFKPIKVTSIYAEVSDQILTLIRTGNLKPGDQLPSEAQLCRQFGVSRSPVREALKALELLGIIESKPGVGSFVKEGQPSDAAFSLLQELAEDGSPSEILEARLVVEPDIAALAAEHATEQDLQALKRTLTIMEQLVAKGERTMEIDLEFHLLLAAASQNAVLADCMRLISGRMTKRFWQEMKGQTLQVSGRPAKYLEHHRQIVEAIGERNSQAAETAMRLHLNEIVTSL